MNPEKRDLILSVETATRGGSLAILHGETIVSVWRGNPDFSHSNGLLLKIQDLLRQAGAKTKDLNLLAAVVGPGSFTDLRIGLATVKGLAAVGEIPVIGVPTLEAMAFSRQQINPICSLLPAGRTDFFAQVFSGERDKIPDQLRIGTLEKILFGLKTIDHLSFVAPLEIHQNIAQFIENEQIKGWSKIAPPPINLAVCVGQIAFKLFRQNESKIDPWRLIYGRQAVIGKNHD